MKIYTYLQIGNGPNSRNRWKSSAKNDKRASSTNRNKRSAVAIFHWKKEKKVLYFFLFNFFEGIDNDQKEELNQRDVSDVDHIQPKFVSDIEDNELIGTWFFLKNLKINKNKNVILKNINNKYYNKIIKN